MKKINFILQEFLKFLLIFLLIFVWARYALRKLWLSLLISLAITSVIYVILFFILRKKATKNSMKIKEKEDAENMFLSLSCDNKRMDFFVKLASKKHQNVKKHSDYLVVTHENNVKTILFCEFSFENLTPSRFIQIYNKLKKERATKIVILCYEHDRDIDAFASNFPEKILLFNRYETYFKLYKYYDCSPEIKQAYKKEKMMAFKDFIAFSFNKKRAKGYLFSSIILIISALFVRASIYYCVVASVLIVFAIISQFNHVFNVRDDSEIL